jgi:trigger factor
LEEIRERNSIVIDRDEGDTAQNGDIVTVDHIELDENGEGKPETERKDFVFTLGSNLSAYRFDDEIAGMKKGETQEFSKTYPEGEASGSSAFAGKTLKLKVTLTAIKEKKLPDLDDDLAQDVDEKYHTLGDLKNSIRERLEKHLEESLKNEKINTLIEKIMENTPVILPESMVKMESDGRLRNFARQLGMDSEAVLKMMAKSGKDPDELAQKWRSGAERALHSRLIVETLIEEQHIEASDADVDDELHRIADAEGQPFEAIQEQYAGNDALEYVKDSIRERKLFDLLLTENTVKPGSAMNYLDFIEKNR